MVCVKSVLERVNNRFATQSISFKDDQNGGITVFVCVMFLIMVVSAGMAVDFMRHETYRSQLQDSLDRGALAAAAFSQTLAPQDTVESFIETHHWHDRSVTVDVDTVDTETFRRVTANGTFEFGTYFLRLIGIPTLKVTARGTAEEKRPNIEISMVLDISPSMAEGNKMTNLKSAAGDFVDYVITDETKDRTTISLVPYAGHVNAGQALYSKYLTYNNKHSDSYCMEFVSDDFTTTELTNDTWREQVPHFQWGTFSSYPTGTGWGWCPTSGNEIVALSNNATALKTAINDMGMHEATGIQNGLKWGVALVDPETKPIVAALSLDGVIDSSFSGRPAAFADATTLKFVVLMTDGKITQQYRPRSKYYDSEYWINIWKSYNMSGYRDNQGKPYYYEDQSSSDTHDDLMTLCTAARNAEIKVFTIGFEVNDTSAQTMEDCAYAPTYFYRVDGLDIEVAFAQIAKTIQNLKLTE